MLATPTPIPTLTHTYLQAAATSDTTNETFSGRNQHQRLTRYTELKREASLRYQRWLIGIVLRPCRYAASALLQANRVGS